MVSISLWCSRTSSAELGLQIRNGNSVQLGFTSGCLSTAPLRQPRASDEPSIDGERTVISSSGRINSTCSIVTTSRDRTTFFPSVKNSRSLAALKHGVLVGSSSNERTLLGKHGESSVAASTSSVLQINRPPLRLVEAIQRPSGEQASPVSSTILSKTPASRMRVIVLTLLTSCALYIKRAGFCLPFKSSQIRPCGC